MSGRANEVVEVLERRGVDICCAQETRWKGYGAQWIVGKNKRYRIYLKGDESEKAKGGVGVLVAEEWESSVIDVRRVSGRLIVLKMKVGERVINVLSAYAPQAGLSRESKERFRGDTISVISDLSETDTVVLAGDLNGHVGACADGYDDVHGGFGYGRRNLEGEYILESCVALNMVVCNSKFKKRLSHLITYSSGGTSSQIDYFLVSRKDWKFVRDVKVIPGEECISQHKLLVCDMSIRRDPVRKKVYMPKRKVWLLKETEYKVSYYREIQELVRNRVARPEGVSSHWDFLEGGVLAAADKVCGKTKGPPRNKIPLWWNDAVDLAIREKRRLYKEHKKGGPREPYLAAKRKAKKEVYLAKKVIQDLVIDQVSDAENPNGIFNLARRIKEDGRDIVVERCVRKDDGTIAYVDKEIRDAWKVHYDRLLNVEFEWDREQLSTENPVLGPPPDDCH
ncbi:hypothetical protein Pmani_022730 [Petrolisthes manimaculis]|uniref:Endonuclease/exonuclease/phosphatase domain-containing protein n=1 Tax=Petrolisthes manimaculis TaxID=1843537 RepID=A0AAE1PBJ0_9EUCA|nr:hypothetical protein Pmani_022730 [Petrolisthes manimaculis]